jgi:hypothetical protein
MPFKGISLKKFEKMQIKPIRIILEAIIMTIDVHACAATALIFRNYGT